MLTKLGFPQSIPTFFHADNTSAIQITTNKVYYEHTQQIEVDRHYIRETVNTCIISLPHVSTDLHITNVFTKSLTRQHH